MEMYQVEVKSEGDLIIIKQEDVRNPSVIVLHREQIPLLVEWLTRESLKDWVIK